MRILGRQVYGAAAVALGLIGLWWRDFATVWQPVPAELPGREALACIAALISLICGTALQSRRTAGPAGLVLAGLYAVYAALWSRRIIGYPSIFATWAGTAEELALVLAGVLVFLGVGKHRPPGERVERACVISFGACAISFGFLHFLSIPQTAAMVPAWLPPGTRFWAVATGVFHVAAGIALVTGIAARPAGWSLAAMFVGFGALVWLPILLAQPQDHTAWAGNAINLALTGAAWIVAERARSRRLPGTRRQGTGGIAAALSGDRAAPTGPDV